ncbi:MAG TPA: hypothetical protein VMN60_01755 [Longimicrobiales bacterium]|nr:hypothetical protein [Longimicrobiales bacterium]
MAPPFFVLRRCGICVAHLGRFLFRPDALGRWAVERESSPLLRGDTMADVVARAHDMPDAQLLRVLHALG